MKSDKEFCLECQEPHSKLAKQVLHPIAHTPGPWHRNIKPATKYTTVWAGKNIHIAHISPSFITPEEAEANISLIAAAPDLLEALIIIFESRLIMCGENIEKVSWILNIARKAIVKAKGE